MHLLPDLGVGGGQTLVLQLARHLDHERFRLTIISLGRADDLKEAFVGCGAEVVVLEQPIRGPMAGIARVTSILRRVRPDLLHLHSEVDRRYGQPAALVLGIPVVRHIHAQLPHLGPRGGGITVQARSRVSTLLERLAVDHYIATSRSAVGHWSPVVSSGISVMSHGIEIEPFRRSPERRRRVRRDLGLPEAVPVLICVARLEHDKGHEDLLAVMREVKASHPDAVLLLVGDGSLRVDLEQSFVRAGMSDDVRFLRTRQDVPDLLAASDLFVFPSRHEGFGLALLEAQAAGIPVVAYDLPVFHEVVHVGSSAALVPPFERGAFARVAAGLVRDRPSRRRLGDAGQRWVEQRFPADAVARSIEDVYTAVLDRDGATALRQNDPGSTVSSARVP